MSRWHICKDARGNLGWESSGKMVPNEEAHGPTLPPLPSMADHRDLDAGAGSLFCTASGKKVAVSCAALARAKSLLGIDAQMVSDDPTSPLLSRTSLNGRRLSQAPASVKFHTAGGRSLSVSRDALERAKTLLADPTFLNEDPAIKTDVHSPAAANTKHFSKSFICPLKSSSHQNPVNLLNKFDAVDDNNGNASMINSVSTSTVVANHSNGGRKRLGSRTTSTPPFKRPRFTAPYFHTNLASAPTGSSSGPRHRVSTTYPFQAPRMSINQFFEHPSLHKSMFEHVPYQVRCIKPVTAENYSFCDESGLACIGFEAFHHMLLHSGASLQFASKQWVINHYKWIVWKLACYERLCPSKYAKRFLTVSNVLEELKYRYEREVNHGHRSAIKRILEGDSPPSSMLVLCISAIDISRKTNIETRASNGSDAGRVVELTDGWYSVDAVLDVPLSKQLAAGKLFVGQKLRIWGAGLCGWDGPVSPLQLLASRTASFLLHVNGTYRAHWADRLGFCKNVIPLAFRCIKSNGGLIPQTLVGVTRIYPVLYKEKLSNGGSIVRSERMESKAMHMLNQRKSALIEGIISEFQREMKGSHVYNESDSEGAKLWEILEAASEPEVLMADMSPEQLTSFASYQAKVEATKQLDMEKAIEKALTDAGLRERDVTPFMKARVVGLTNNHEKGVVKEGLVTIWNPTEKQQSELVEGQAYAVAGLLPVNSDSYMLYLQARGSTTKWQPLSTLATQNFKPFFSPRVSVSLSNLGEVPLSNEFDTAAYVVHVGEVHSTAHLRKQWVFVTDSSISTFKSQEISNSLLAISFCSHDDSFTPINCNLVGTTVGFFNLIKKAEDRMNHVWTAEATENSTYLANPDSSHLKTAATAVQTWAKTSRMIVDKLKEKVLFIVGDRKG